MRTTAAQKELHALQVIAEKLLDYLRSATDDGEKAEVAQRIGELAERFAPDTQWFIDTMNQVGSSLCLETPSNEAIVMRLPEAVSIRICTHLRWHPVMTALL